MNNIEDNIIYPPNNEIWYTTIDGNIIDVDTIYINNNLLSNTYEDKGVLVFENDINSIQRLFMSNKQLTKVWLPNYEINSTEFAFTECTNLIQVNNSKQLKAIDGFAFGGCENLQQIEIDSNYIGNTAFFGCDYLNYVKISKRIESIGSAAFNYCTNLESINYEGTIEEWNKIDIYSDWRDNSVIKTIHCTDGDIIL